MSSPFIGQIMIFAGNFAPLGWTLCDGHEEPIAANQQLFHVIGTTYGGDGVTTFAVPDLRGCAPMGQGQGRGMSSYRLGQAVGAEAVVLTTAQLPSHAHMVNAATGPGNSNVPAANTVLSGVGGQAASGQFETPAYAAPGHETPLNVNTIAATGGGQPHDNMQPYLVLNFCIATSGATP
jgi:microcystin-dependent protein